jgi:RimJ/RimL family protein N-acetyltransferase
MTPAATTRLAFRAWRPDDLALAEALFGDPRVTALVGGPFDRAEIAARLATELANDATHGYCYWVLQSGASFVGCCGLKPREPGTHELGFYIGPAYWRGGYAVEASRAVIAHAFETLDANALFAGHHPENHGSRAVLARLGFTYAFDELYPPTGLQHPGYLLRNPRRPAP